MSGLSVKARKSPLVHLNDTPNFSSNEMQQYIFLPIAKAKTEPHLTSSVVCLSARQWLMTSSNFMTPNPNEPEPNGRSQTGFHTDHRFLAVCRFSSVWNIFAFFAQI